MKQLLLSIFLILFFCRLTFSQCTPAIPSNAVVVSTTDEIDGGFDPIWVCSDATLNSDGGFHNIFMESGSTMTTGGGIDTIYVKSGASFFMDGGIHVIFYENESDLHLNGGIPYTFSCSSMAFDYTNAPPNGCSVVVTAALSSSDSIFCSGSCVSFSSLSENATSWQWTFDGGTPSSSTDENPELVCYDNEGGFNVTLIASNGTSSDTVSYDNFITVNAQPLAPILSQSGDTLFSSTGYVTYQWYLDNTIIPGATNYFYVPAQGGEYSILVTNSKGCEASALINYFPVGISSSQTQSLNIFPNPATNILTISNDREENLQFIDLFGEVLFSVKSSSAKNVTVDISSLPTTFLIRSESGALTKVIRYR